jgi:hypothetical protein
LHPGGIRTDEPLLPRRTWRRWATTPMLGRLELEFKVCGRILTFCARVGRPGLPDGMFSDQKIAIWVNFGGPCNGRC